MKATSRGISLLLVLVTVLSLLSVGVIAEEPVPAIGSYTLVKEATPGALGTVSYTYSKDKDADGYYDAEDLPQSKDLTYLSQSMCIGSYVVPAGGSTTPREPKWNAPWTSYYFRFLASGTKYQVLTSNGNSAAYPQGTDAKGTYRQAANGAKYYATDMVLGGKGDRFNHGISLVPSASGTQNYILFDVDGYDYFYSVAGMNGSAFNTKGNSVIYEVFGSPVANAPVDSDSFQLLADSKALTQWQTREFQVPITGVKTLKLVARIGGSSNSGTNSLWGNPCVFTATRPQNLMWTSLAIPTCVW